MGDPGFNGSLDPFDGTVDPSTGVPIQRPDGSTFILPAQLAQALQQGMINGGQPSPTQQPSPQGGGLLDGMGIGQGQGAQPQQQPMAFPPPPTPAPIPKMRGSYDATPQDVQAANSQNQVDYYTAAAKAAQGQQQQKANDLLEKGLSASKDEFARNADAQQQRMQRYQASSDQFRSELKQYASQNVDPNQFFNNTSTWGKIAMGVSIAISGFLNPRGQNQAIQHIQKLVDDNISTQKMNLDRQGQVLSMEHSLNQEDESRGDQQFKMDEMRRATAWGFVAQQAALEAQRSSTPMAQANAQRLMAEAKANVDKAIATGTGKMYDLQEKASSAYASLAVEKAKERFLPQEEEIKGRTKMMEDMNKAAITPAKAGAAGSQLPITWNGQIMGTVPKEEYKEVSEKYGAIVKTLNGIATLKSMIKQNGQLRPDLPLANNPEVAAEQTLYKNVLFGLRSVNDLSKRVSDSSRKLEEEALGAGPETWVKNRNSLSKLDSEMGFVQHQADYLKKRYGLQVPTDRDLVNIHGEGQGSQASPTQGQSSGALDDLGSIPGAP